MSYAVKEIYYTLQGEGYHSGKAAVFLRFSGCNLWNGLDTGRGTGAGGCSRWCDTDFVGTDGPGGGAYGTAAQLASTVANTWRGKSGQRPFVVCTGGEPMLQLDEPLLAALHEHDFFVAVETNGTRPVPKGVDWICVSPKPGPTVVVREGDELKLVVPQEGIEPAAVEGWRFQHFFLQPLDDAQQDDHARWAVEYCLRHPQWRISTQAHKLLGIA
jgi:7-carboxy-7-deazaguanine synthase